MAPKEWSWCSFIVIVDFFWVVGVAPVLVRNGALSVFFLNIDDTAKCVTMRFRFAMGSFKNRGQLKNSLAILLTPVPNASFVGIRSFPLVPSTNFYRRQFAFERGEVFLQAVSCFLYILRVWQKWSNAFQDTEHNNLRRWTTEVVDG